MPVAGLLTISVYEAKGGGIEGEDYMVLIGIPKRSEGNIILSSTVGETGTNLRSASRLNA